LENKRSYQAHTLWDLRGKIGSSLSATEGKLHNVNVLGEQIAKRGGLYIVDRAYLNFERLYLLNQQMTLFIVRSKNHTRSSFAELISSMIERRKFFFLGK
jgi:hypothetical protein